MDVLGHAVRLCFLEPPKNREREIRMKWMSRMSKRKKVINDNNNNGEEMWASNSTEESETKSSNSANLLQRLSSTDRNRRCWVCFAAEEDEDAPDDAWVHPCSCKKSMKWVHEMCLNRWVDEKQNGNAFLPVKCPFCLNPYQFEYPEESTIFKPVSVFENCILWATNNVPAFLILRFGSSIFEIHYFAPDLLFLQKLVLIVLTELVLPVPWTLMLLLDLRVREWEMAGIKATLDDSVSIPRQERAMELIQTLDLGDFIRVRILPSLAILMGEAVFGDLVENRPLRALAGGLVFALARACVRIPYRRSQYKMAASRRVKNMETLPSAAPAQSGETGDVSIRSSSSQE